MTVVCDIQFDQNPYGTYYAGQTVTGKVTMTVNKPKNVKGVTLKISGYAKTNWSETETYHGTDSHGHSSSQTRSVDYYGREDYLSSITYLMGSEYSDQVTIEPGFHTYSFACPLPMQCPSSYEGAWGHIRYVAKVVLIRPWKLDQTYTVGLTVLKNSNLNYDSPLLRLPTNMEYIKHFCCGPCRTKPVIINAMVPQTGYVSGQGIPVTININNPTKVTITGITISLNLIATFHTQYPHYHTRWDATCLAKSKSREVIGKHCQGVVTDTIQIPPTPPTCANLCSLIKIMYELKIEAKVSGLHENPLIVIPITIGSAPLVNFNQSQPMMIQPAVVQGSEQPTPAMQMAEINPVWNGSPSATYSPDMQDIPPPTYEQAVFMKQTTMADEEDKDTLGTTEFAPRYPVYSMMSGMISTTRNQEDEVDYSADAGKSTWL